MSQDTSSTGLFNMIFGAIAGQIFKVAVVVGLGAAAVTGTMFLIFR